MRMLITGAQGFVGRYLTSAALRSRPDIEVVGLGRSPRRDGYFSHDVTVHGTRVSAPVPENLRVTDGRYRYEQVDLNESPALRTIVDRFQPDTVVHLASGLRGDDSRLLVQTNIAGTASLLAALGAACQRPPVVVLGSTGGVYGAVASEALPIVETAPANPADIYSATKLAAEHISRIVCDEHRMTCVVARIFNIVGPGQSERHVCGRFASSIAAAATSSISAVSAGCLTGTRDYVDVRDVASALLVLAGSGTGTYNVASGIETSTGTVLHLLSRHAGLEGRLHVIPSEQVLPGVARQCGSVARLASLGFRPAFTLQRSLQDLLDYYVEAARHAAPSLAPTV